ncbi:ShlB/FhaC/HecB family hemolysin secretion/activation protein [Thermocoleostomius sinensis]|uniref:ShlB/FhaC/HecB family hemolysin secretion/activation protein n=1 Tax=Thermocoleostomius sinensis A174 TaxID=2016057 RepID=A0A9E8ZJK3_9CYAN|nr:ShlB/FhaC/HecB family hemolysin secretion/activation protein [Thermocoleostomius sinensis]WAL62922.1 ShlB/FhaC/HecB family hemolysin secretion/activation protein [Thermocoleostomius sinensis A174]
MLLSTFTNTIPGAIAQPLPPGAIDPSTIDPTDIPDRQLDLPLPPPIPQPRPSDLLEPLPDQPPASPPDPELQTPDSTIPSIDPAISASFFVETIEVSGNTVLSDEIATLTAAYENRDVTFEELIALRSQITQLYFDNGYITSGAFLPNNQDLSDGTVEIQVIEGEIEQIEVCLLSPRSGLVDAESEQSPDAEEPSATPAQPRCGSARLRDAYVRDRLRLASGTPVNQRRLEEALQLLQLNPLITQVNAELTAGNAPGRNVLRVQVREAPAFHAGIGVDNYQSPSIGSVQLGVFASYDNVLGFGDRISGGYSLTEGLDSYDIGYAFPVNALDGTLQARYSRDDSIIVQEQFEDLEIRSESETFSFGFRQPIVRRPQTEFALGLTFDLRRSQTFILNDIPFSFSEGPDDGESKVSVLRFSQEWVDRNARQVLAARSQFSVGLDIFDATVNDIGTDGRFFAWLGQFQYVQQLNSAGWLLLARVDTQLTPDSLLPLEQFAIGGAGTVRGYRQNQFVTDNGILGGLEFRIPLTDDPQELQLTPFVDVGYGWNNRTPDPNLALVSTGLGVRWQVTRDLNMRLDYGIPLVAIEGRGDSLQEDGFLFSIRYQPF